MAIKVSSMIEVELEFVIYFYLLSTACLVGILWFCMRARDIADWRDFAFKGRTPIRTCENCGSRYVDSRAGTYSTCSVCQYLNERA